MKLPTVADLIEQGITAEKAEIIADYLQKAKFCINNIEVELYETNLKDQLLVPDKTYPTIWIQLYHLQKLFNQLIPTKK